MFKSIDRAVLYSFGFRSLSVIAGPVTVAVIAFCFTPELQGYFYTFNAILTMQVLLELGLGTALQQITSHEWAKLTFNDRGGITGDSKARARLVTVARFALKWYSAAGVLAFLGFSLGGALFFSGSSEEGVYFWQAPWWILSIAAGANLFLSPAFSILEGCNQVRQVYGFRLGQGIVIRLGLWIAMLLGCGLWALVVERLLTFALALFFLWRRYSNLFKSLFRGTTVQDEFWQTEIWPLQWRFAIVWISGFMPSLFIPVLFAYQGPVAAGQIGMTWAITAALLSLSHALITPKMPRMAIHIARFEFGKLDKLFHRTLIACLSLLVTGSIAFMVGLFFLHAHYPDLAARFLPPMPTVFLLGATLLQQVRIAMGTYLRAHKKEPLLVISIVEAALTLAILFPLGKLYGATGIAIGFFAVSALVYFPAYRIFLRCRNEWHGENYTSDVSDR